MKRSHLQNKKVLQNRLLYQININTFKNDILESQQAHTPLQITKITTPVYDPHLFGQ